MSTVIPSGLVNFDKPADWTSFDVVNRVRNILRKGLLESTGQTSKIKVGHSGTLDPFATGLLRIGFGDCTKKLGNLAKQDKTYQGTMVLGWTSTTGDKEGGLSKLTAQIQPQRSELEHAFKAFVGAISQTPPAHSAVKVGGIRAYRLARQGEAPQLKPRQVRIYDFKLAQYRYPRVSFSCRVSSGTYIRTLAEDVAKALGTSAYLEDLRRLSIGDQTVEGALDPRVATYQEIINKSVNCLGA